MADANKVGYRAVLVTGRPLPVTALNDFGGQAVDLGFSLVLFATGDTKRPAALDPRIKVERLRVRGRTRVGGKARSAAAKLAVRGNIRQRTLGLAVLDSGLHKAASQADVLVALDPDSALAVWALARRHRSVLAVLGLPELARIAAEELQ